LDSGSGAIISVRDDQGRSLVEFRSDQNGVNLSLKDRHGRNLLKLLAEAKPLFLFSYQDRTAW